MAAAWKTLRLFMIVSAAFLPLSISSSASAEERSYAAGVEFLGRSPYPLRSEGARAAYRIQGTREIELSYVRSQHDVLLTDYRYGELGFMLKSFVNTMFYWGIGLSLRDITLEYDMHSDNQEILKEIKESHQALAVNAKFGLEKTFWDFLSLGTDLFTFAVPVHWLKEDDRFPKEAKDYAEDPKRYPYVNSGFTNHMHVLRTYVMVRF